MRWSGCPASCGNHHTADVGLQGCKVKVDGKIVDGVHVFVGGRGGADPRAGVRILEDVPCDELPEVLERLVRFFPRGDRKDDGRREPRARVSFVGAGPGDPELITLKALRRLREADVVIHDRLIPSSCSTRRGATPRSSTPARRRAATASARRRSTGCS